MIAGLLAVALAGPMVDIPEDVARPLLAEALGCEARLERLVTVWELPGTAGWALAACPDAAARLVVFAEGEPGRPSGAWSVVLDGTPTVHGFVDRSRTVLGLEEVGRTMRLSGGVRHQRRPALVVELPDPRRLVLLELGAHPPRVVLEADVTAARVNVRGTEDPPRLEVVPTEGPPVPL